MARGHHRLDSLSKLREFVMDREAWCAVIMASTPPLWSAFLSPPGEGFLASFSLLLLPSMALHRTTLVIFLADLLLCPESEEALD